MMTATDQGERTHRAYWTIGEVAEHCRVAEKTVRRWIARGDLIAIKMRGSLRIPDAELRLYLQRSTIVH